jgi:protein phosphatase 1 regulatory subunit 32
MPRRLYASRIPSEAYTGLGNVPPLVAARIKKKDPAEYMNLIHKDNFRSVTSASFQGRQRNPRTEEQLLDKEHMGELELSGDSKNNDIYNETKDSDPERYLTNYNLRHYDMNPRGIDREGYIMRGSQTAREDGFSRDFGVHSLGGRMNDMTLKLQRLQPYTARSIKRRDRYIVDHTHKHKVVNDHEGVPAIEPLSTATLQVHG